MGSLWSPPLRNWTAEIQLDPSFYLWSCSGVLPLPWGKLRTQHQHRDGQTDPIWTHRWSRLTNQHSYTGTGTHRPQHQRTQSGIPRAEVKGHHLFKTGLHGHGMSRKDAGQMGPNSTRTALKTDECINGAGKAKMLDRRQWVPWKGIYTEREG